MTLSQLVQAAAAGDPQSPIHVVLPEDVWVIIPAWLTLGLLLLAAGVAYAQTREARRLRDAQMRPYVVVDLDVSQPPVIYLTVENTGKTMATDVQFEVDPPLKSSLSRDEPTRTILDKPWPVLAPGKRVRSLFDSATSRYAASESLAAEHRIKMTYSGPLSKKPYREEYRLDFSVYDDLRYRWGRGWDELVGAIEDIKSQLSRWDHLGGLGVFTKDRDEYTQEVIGPYVQPPTSAAEEPADADDADDGGHGAAQE